MDPTGAKPRAHNHGAPAPVGSVLCGHCGQPVPESDWCCEEAMREGMLAAVARWWDDED